MIRIAGPALILALLLAPGATAQMQLTGQLSASQLDADGPAVTTATLRALFQTDVPGAAGPSGSSFILQAGRVRVETEEADPVLTDPTGTAAGAPIPAQEVHEYSDAKLTGLPPRPGYQLELLPLQGHDLPRMRSVGCTSIQPTDRGQAVHEPLVNAQRQFGVDVSRALLWRSSCDNQIRVEGAFVLTLWEWDGTLESDGRSLELESGHDRSDQAAALYPTVAKTRQQYLFVEDGHLELVPVPQRSTAFLESAVMSAPGEVRFNEVQGQLVHGQANHEIASSRLVLDGDLSLDLPTQADDTAIRLGVRGTVVSGHSDGQVLSFAAAQAPEAPRWLWAAALVAALALAIGVPFGLLRSRNAYARLEAVAQLPPTHAAQAEQVCTDLIKRMPRLSRAYYFRGRARAHLGDLEGARADLDEALARLPNSDRFYHLATWQADIVAQALKTAPARPSRPAASPHARATFHAWVG